MWGTAATVASGDSPWIWHPLRWPLYLRVILGVAIGTTLGVVFGSREIAMGWTNAHLGIVAGFYIQLLTALATPLIFFAVVEAFVQTSITGWQGLKMFLICAVNIAAAFLIGLTILNVWQPGRVWEGKLAERAGPTSAEAMAKAGAKLPVLDAW